ncbi:MAG TPA: type II secretion system protein [Firmicutes bacterium]|nr:type II secretion system protein [Bacillota bacterium]
MRIQTIKRGMTLIEMIVTLTLFGVTSLGVITAYITASKQTERAMLKSETVTVARIVTDTLLKDIQRAKNVSWADPVLTVTLYNDIVVTYTTENTAKGKRITRDGTPVVTSDYADISFVTSPAPLIDTYAKEVRLSLQIVVTRESVTETSVFNLTGHWRNI